MCVPSFVPLQQYVPLFLCKEDLDIAVQSAYKQRNAAQIKMYKDKALKYQEEYDQVGVCLLVGFALSAHPPTMCMLKFPDVLQ